jgi:radical SAM superfamily enzyme YgiQ (UPF0313 family)
LDGRLALIQTVKNYILNNGRVVDPVHGHYTDNIHLSAKLNGLVLYHYLSKRGFRVGLIDSFKNQRREFDKFVSEEPKAIILSTTFICSKETLWRLAEVIRASVQDSYVIAGGPFVYSSYLLLQRSFDTNYDTDRPKNDYLFLDENSAGDNVDLYIVSPTGLVTLEKTLGLLWEGKDPANLPNTAHSRHEKYVFSRLREEPICWCDLTVDWQEMPAEVFRSGVVSVAASNGCPFDCAFCNFVKDGKSAYVKPVEDLIHELRVISSKGVKYIRFVDDNFRLGKNDLNAVCKRFIEEGFTFKWISFIRAGTLRSADMQLLRKAGCVGVYIGVESADKSVLENMNKKTDPEMYRAVIKAALKAGIDCNCFFIVGFPGETEETFDRTIRFIERIQDDEDEGIFYWSMFPFILAPLSPIYEAKNRAKYNLKGYLETWEHKTLTSDGAKKLILKAYNQIERSTPMYPGDNMDMLMTLSKDKRKEFVRLRHRLSKLHGNALNPHLILEMFKNVF